jgi:hypothetical protein
MKIDWEEWTIAALVLMMVIIWILGVSWGYF